MKLVNESVKYAINISNIGILSDSIVIKKKFWLKNNKVAMRNWVLFALPVDMKPTKLDKSLKYIKDSFKSYPIKNYDRVIREIKFEI